MSDETPPIEVQTFFWVIIDNRGNPTILTQMPSVDVVADHEATIEEIRRAVLEINEDIRANAISRSVKIILNANQPEAVAESVKKALKERGHDSRSRRNNR